MLTKFSSLFRKAEPMATPPNSLKTNSSTTGTSDSGASRSSVKKEIDIKMSETNSTNSAPASSDKGSPAKRKAATTAHKEPVEQQKATASLPTELIAQRAFEIWHEEGCPADRRDANWLQAEKEIRAKMAAQ